MSAADVGNLDCPCLLLKLLLSKAFGHLESSRLLHWWYEQYLP